MKIEFTDIEWQEIRYALADEFIHQKALMEAAKKSGWKEIEDLIELRQDRIDIISKIQKKIYEQMEDKK